MRNPASLLPGRKHRRRAEDGQPAAGVTAEVPGGNFRAAPRHAATEARQPFNLLPAPTADGERGRAPAPSFHARTTEETAPIPLPVTGRPYMQDSPLDPGTPVWPGARPVIGDGMHVSVPVAPSAFLAGAALRWLEEADEAGREPTGLPYTQPGWAKLQMDRWVALGEWDALHLIVERGLDLNAAAMAVGLRHTRAAIRDGVRQGCAAMGYAALAGPLLQRTQELVLAARAAAAAAGAQ